MMLLSTSQLSKVHHLDIANIDIAANNTSLKRVPTTKLLGSHIHEHLNWEENVKHVAASCYATLTSIRKLKKTLPFHIKKNLVQALVLSKLHYNDIVYYTLSQTTCQNVFREFKRLQLVSYSADMLPLKIFY